MDTLTAAVIHDVKNQLGELALRLERRGNCGHETSLVLQACNRLSELLLAMRRQAGKLEANVDSASPSDLIRELAAEYRSMFPELTIDENAVAAPSFAFYDASLVRMALANAMHNACRHAKNLVLLSARTEGASLVFEIRDDGDGFPQDILQRVPGRPLPVGSTGTGLGLWLADEIACLHRLEDRAGHVTLENDGGGCFRMTLP